MRACHLTLTRAPTPKNESLGGLRRCEQRRLSDTAGSRILGRHLRRRQPAGWGRHRDNLERRARPASESDGTGSPNFGRASRLISAPILIVSGRPLMPSARNVLSAATPPVTYSNARPALRRCQWWTFGAVPSSPWSFCCLSLPSPLFFLLIPCSPLLLLPLLRTPRLPLPPLRLTLLPLLLLPPTPSRVFPPLFPPIPPSAFSTLPLPPPVPPPPPLPPQNASTKWFLNSARDSEATTTTTTRKLSWLPQTVRSSSFCILALTIPSLLCNIWLGKSFETDVGTWDSMV